MVSPAVKWTSVCTATRTHDHRHAHTRPQNRRANQKFPQILNEIGLSIRFLICIALYHPAPRSNDLPKIPRLSVPGACEDHWVCRRRIAVSYCGCYCTVMARSHGITVPFRRQERRTFAHGTHCHVCVLTPQASPTICSLDVIKGAPWQLTKRVSLLKQLANRSSDTRTLFFGGDRAHKEETGPN